MQPKCVWFSDEPVNNISLYFIRHRTRAEKIILHHSKTLIHSSRELFIKSLLCYVACILIASAIIILSFVFNEGFFYEKAVRVCKQNEFVDLFDGGDLCVELELEFDFPNWTPYERIICRLLTRYEI